MLVFERIETLQGVAYIPLPLSVQTLCTADDVLRLMQKHVASDNSVHGLHVVFEGERVHLTRVEELLIVAKLAAAHNNALVEEHFKHEKGLDGKPYGREQEDEKVHKEQRTHNEKTLSNTSKKALKQPQANWDEELHGDRYVFDAAFEQHEDLLPWRDKRQDERFGWDM